MNLVADESLDRPIVERLRRAGHTVESIAERSPGVDDQQVLELSVRLKAVLLTADRDFGEMVIRQRLANTGVVLVRLSGLGAEQKPTWSLKPSAPMATPWWVRSPSSHPAPSASVTARCLDPERVGMPASSVPERTKPRIFVIPRP